MARGPAERRARKPASCNRPKSKACFCGAAPASTAALADLDRGVLWAAAGSCGGTCSSLPNRSGRRRRIGNHDALPRLRHVKKDATADGVAEVSYKVVFLNGETIVGVTPWVD
jgi:hypothetical protein